MGHITETAQMSLSDMYTQLRADCTTQLKSFLAEQITTVQSLGTDVKITGKINDLKNDFKRIGMCDIESNEHGELDIFLPWTNVIDANLVQLPLDDTLFLWKIYKGIVTPQYIDGRTQAELYIKRWYFTEVSQDLFFGQFSITDIENAMRQNSNSSTQ